MEGHLTLMPSKCTFKLEGFQYHLMNIMLLVRQKQIGRNELAWHATLKHFLLAFQFS